MKYAVLIGLFILVVGGAYYAGYRVGSSDKQVEYVTKQVEVVKYVSQKRQKFMLSLMLAALSCLSSCTTVNSDYCPVWPTAGPTVAAELEKPAVRNFRTLGSG